MREVPRFSIRSRFTNSPKRSRRARAIAATFCARREKGERPYAVLLVDDEPAILESLELTLGSDYRVFKAESGAEGLDILEREEIALVIAVLCYLAAAGCGLGAVLYSSDTIGDPIRASLMAATVFFISCGVVLQVIGTARLRGVLSGSGEHDPD